MENQKIIQAYWQEFLKNTNRPADTKYIEAFHFDITKESAEHLLGLVLQGIKKATASSLYYFQNNQMPMPNIGDYSIITNWEGEPKCIIQTTQITILPFREITFEICKREGEDESLASWQQNHVYFFTEEGKAEGYDFSWDMPVVFEDFKVICQ